MRSPNSPQVSSFAAAEKARATHEACIREIQDLPAANLRILADIVLEDGIERSIAHKLGRRAVFVQVSAVRGAVTTGHIEEVRTGDRTQVVILKPVGWGATITVDVCVL